MTLPDTPEPKPTAAAPTAASVLGRWSDLRPRVLSAAVMIGVGALEIWLGGASFAALVILLTGVMIWELATITGGDPAPPRSTALVIAAVAGLCLSATFALASPMAPVLLAVPPLLLAMTQRRCRRIATVYAAAIMLTGYGLVQLRDGAGSPAILWVVGIVIVSDIAGYFAGRTIGGPKFWPAISPKKTWSGTAAGWIGALAVGAGFVLAGRVPDGAGWGLILLSPAVAFAGQLGDIAESWIKRRTGVKDSSGLIPGHGGVMDRFDAMIGAVGFIMVLGLIIALPLPMER